MSHFAIAISSADAAIAFRRCFRCRHIADISPFSPLCLISVSFRPAAMIFLFWIIFMRRDSFTLPFSPSPPFRRHYFRSLMPPRPPAAAHSHIAEFRFCLRRLLSTALPRHMPLLIRTRPAHISFSRMRAICRLAPATPAIRFYALYFSATVHTED